MAEQRAELDEDRLTLTEQVAVLDETAGAWTDEKHPEMRTGENIDRWLDDLRSSWSRLLTPDFCSLTPDA
jgi:hypothetical protein